MLGTASKTMELEKQSLNTCVNRGFGSVVASRSTEVSVHAVQTKLGLFFLFYLNQGVCFYITIYWKKGKGQKERKRRVSLCLKVLIFTVLPS